MKVAVIIIDALVLVVYSVVALSTYLKVKKSEEKEVEIVKEDLLKRVKYMNILTGIIGILGIITIFLKIFSII